METEYDNALLEEESLRQQLLMDVRVRNAKRQGRAESQGQIGELEYYSNYDRDIRTPDEEHEQRLRGTMTKRFWILDGERERRPESSINRDTRTPDEERERRLRGTIVNNFRILDGEHERRPESSVHRDIRTPDEEHEQRLRGTMINRFRILDGERERRPESNVNLDIRTPDEEHEQRLSGLTENNPRISDGEHEQRPKSRINDCGFRGSVGEHERRLSRESREPHHDWRSGELERRSPSMVRCDIDDVRSVRYRTSREGQCNYGSTIHSLPGFRNNRLRSRSPVRRQRLGDNRSFNIPDSDKRTDMLSEFIHAIKDLSKLGSSRLSNMADVVPEFDPMSKNQPIRHWITKVEECADIYEWNEREIIHYALPKLSGTAKFWYQSLPSVRFTWRDWKAKLIDAFPSRENYAELLSEMLALKVRFAEPLEPYYYSKLNLLHRCRIEGKEAVDCILFGVEDRAIKLGAQAAEFDTPGQVLKYFRSVKVGQAKEYTTKHNKFDKPPIRSVETFNQPTSTVRSPIKCFNCNGDGHPSFRCPKPLEKCNLCYRIGHQSTHCTFSGSNKDRASAQNNKPNNDKQVLNIALTDCSHECLEPTVIDK